MPQFYKWQRELRYLKTPTLIVFCRIFWTFLHFRTMIDTEVNRKAMPDEDHSKWLPPEKIGELLRQWSDGENRPENGSFAKLNFSKGAIVPEFV